MITGIRFGCRFFLDTFFAWLEKVGILGIFNHALKALDLGKKTFWATQELPEAKDTPQVCGKTANGCRLAFDLGKSDIKTVAVKDGEAHLGRDFVDTDDSSSLQRLTRGDLSIYFINLDDPQVQRLSLTGSNRGCVMMFLVFSPLQVKLRWFRYLTISSQYLLNSPL